ncbi:MAG: tagaturonate epimerase family protein [Bacteroidota bacterium]|nr:tagaturonate epimerase family protein [Bacteroidota bacterium]
MKKLGKYSMGLGDRFGHQGHAQLRAIIEAGIHGIEITPVWNKSNREHIIIGTQPQDVRSEADTVTGNAGFKKPYFVDADHINIDTVGRFIDCSDFFTIDVASYIGKRAGEDKIQKFLASAGKLSEGLHIEGIKKSVKCTKAQLRDIADKYIFAAEKAGEIYRMIEAKKGQRNFITEVSMDEVAQPQSPVELLFILFMLGAEKIPVQTIAPKFTGRFNKGVDYVGEPDRFAAEFEEDLMVIAYAVQAFGLPDNLKISIHSGSDKFALYPEINSIIKKHDKGIHLKTAGTTWLEELIGLAEAGGEALDFAKEIYIKALGKIEELCVPYADVIDIDVSSLPSSDEVLVWNSRKFAASLRHDESNPDYNPDMRQLIHVAYKLAAQKTNEYFSLLEEHKQVVSECVFENIYQRHILRLFGKEYKNAFLA